LKSKTDKEILLISVSSKIKSINITIPEPKEEEEEEPIQQEETDIPEDGVIGDLFN